MVAVLMWIALPGLPWKSWLKTGDFQSILKSEKFVDSPDPRVEKALKSLGLKYEVDKDGDYKLIYAVEGERTQVIFIISQTQKLGKLEIREIWSPVAKFTSAPPATLSQALLEQNASFKIGSYQYKKGGSAQFLVFTAHLPANISPEELGSVLSGVASTADAAEKEITGGGDDY